MASDAEWLCGCLNVCPGLIPFRAESIRMSQVSGQSTEQQSLELEEGHIGRRMFDRLWELSPTESAINSRLECLSILGYRTKMIGALGET